MQNNLHDSLGGRKVSQEFAGASGQLAKQTLGLNTDELISEGVDPISLGYCPEMDGELLAELHEAYASEMVDYTIYPDRWGVVARFDQDIDYSSSELGMFLSEVMKRSSRADRLGTPNNYVSNTAYIEMYEGDILVSTACTNEYGSVWSNHDTVIAPRIPEVWDRLLNLINSHS